MTSLRDVTDDDAPHAGLVGGEIRNPFAAAHAVLAGLKPVGPERSVGLHHQQRRDDHACQLRPGVRPLQVLYTFRSSTTVPQLSVLSCGQNLYLFPTWLVY